MSATTQRDHAMQIAASDPGKALSLAEGISDHWFATQALAAVLRYCSADRVRTVLRRALTRASQCPDAYCRSAVLAWVIRALAERRLNPEAADTLRAALQEGLQASPAGSRGEALFLLYQAAHPLGCRSVEPILRHLVALQRSHPHWRVSRALVHACAMHSVMAPESMQSFTQLIGEPKLRAKIHRYMALGLTQPRQFF